MNNNNINLTEEADLTNIKDILTGLISHISGQYQQHVQKFQMKYRNSKHISAVKRYTTIQFYLDMINEANQKFAKNMKETETINKKNIQTCVSKHFIPLFDFNTIIYYSLIGLIKREFTDEEWTSYHLESYQHPNTVTPHHGIPCYLSTEVPFPNQLAFNYSVNFGNIETGEVEIVLEPLINIIEEHIPKYEARNDIIQSKISIIREFLPLLDNHFDNNWEPFNLLFQNNIKYFADRVEWIIKNNNLEAREKPLVKKL